MAGVVRGPRLLGVLEAFATKGRPESGRARRGLYAGKDVLFGNMVSHSNRKTRRMFKPNAHHKRVWSDVMQKMVPFNLTTEALRNIDKCGGLDNYLLSTPDDKLKSESGLRVKRQVQSILHGRELERKRAEEAQTLQKGAADDIAGAGAM